jgi:hypothetical protein
LSGSRTPDRQGGERGGQHPQARPPVEGVTVVTLSLHCIGSVVTLWSHCCHTVVTLLLHCWYLSAAGGGVEIGVDVSVGGVVSGHLIVQ